MSARDSAIELFECFRRPLNSVNLRRLLLLHMRVHWSDAANYGDLEKDLGCLIYSDDGSGSLHVLLNYELDHRTTDQFPAVIVGFGDTQTAKNTLDNYAGSAADYSAKYYSLPAQIPVTVSHVHSKADVALAMAESSATFLMGIRESIMRRLSLRAFNVTGVSRIRPLEKMPARFYSVEVGLAIDFNMAVTVNIEGHRLKKYGQEFAASS